jgi:hypothetical protein
MSKEFFESIIAHGGFAGQSYDANIGPFNAGVIDALLNAATPTATLQSDAPINIVSTGALGGAKSLDLSLIEDNGRLLYLSARNSDIAVNNLTLIPTTTINGAGTLVIAASTDLILVHETGGVWRAYYQSTTGVGGGVFTASEKSNLELEMEFKAAQLTTFKELSYTGKNLTGIDIYVDITKVVQLFSKVLSYTGKNLTQTVLTRVSDAAILTRDFAYSGNNLISIETT